MKITAKRESFLKAMQKAVAVIPAKPSKPILSYVQLTVLPDKSQLTATSIDLSLQVSVPDVVATECGTVMLPARLNAVLQNADCEAIEMELNGSLLKVKASGLFEFPTVPPDEFPATQAVAFDNCYSMKEVSFEELLNRTIYACGSGVLHGAALDGVYLEMSKDEVHAVAIESGMMAIAKAPMEVVGQPEVVDGQTIIPTAFARTIAKLIGGEDDLKIRVMPNQIHFASSRMALSSSLLVGRFPNWRNILDRFSTGDTQTVELVVPSLLSALNRIAVVSTSENRWAVFTFTPGKLLIEAESAEIGKSDVEVPIAYAGPDRKYVLNHYQLSQFLRVLYQGQNISMTIGNENGGVVCRADTRYTFVTMTKEE